MQKGVGGFLRVGGRSPSGNSWNAVASQCTSAKKCTPSKLLLSSIHHHWTDEEISCLAQYMHCTIALVCLVSASLSVTRAVSCILLAPLLLTALYFGHSASPPLLVVS